MNESLSRTLSQNPSLADLLAALREKEHATAPEQLWKRIALSQQFDAQLYHQLSSGLGVPSFSAFVKLRDVQPVEQEQWYSLKDVTRTRFLQRWSRTDPDLPRTSESLLASATHPEDQFRHRLLARPADALKDFHTQFARADDAFDLTCCERLLGIMRERSWLLSPELQAALSDREQYLESRRLFADDYYATARYLDRQELLTPFREFRASKPKWIFNVHGKGGAGKTMFVRWLIARHCLPGKPGERLPVARVDFDLLDLSLVANAPWLVLLVMAVQLRPQMPRSPFLTLLEPDDIQLAGLLRRLGGPEKSEDRQSLVNSALQRRARTVQMFSTGLGKNEVLIILDTFEELSLHHRQGILPLFDVLGEIRKNCPGFRVLISGRYSLLETSDTDLPVLPLTNEVREAIREVVLPPLDLPNSVSFLASVCQLPADRPLSAIAAKSAGNPFALSLFAELAMSRPLLTDKEVEECPDVLFAYLIERVIARIPDELENEIDPPEIRQRKRTQRAIRWLLRYAVVPSRLTREVFDGVLSKYLREEMAQRSRLDSPEELGAAGRSYDGRRLWRPSADPLDLANVWSALNQYASGSSWIVREENGFQLQPEVVIPMRELLRSNPQAFPVFDALHLACARFFEARALEEPDRCGSLLGDALYHHFQREGQHAEPWWSIYTELAGGPSFVRELCERMLGKDFVGAQKQPLPHGRAGRIISPALLARIAFHRCRAAVFEYLSEPIVGHKIASNTLNNFYEDYQAFDKKLEKRMFRLAEIGLVEAAIALESGKPAKPEEALKKLSEAMAGDLVWPEDRVAFRLLRARAKEVLGAAPGELIPEYAAAIGGAPAEATFPSHLLLALQARMLTRVHPDQGRTAWKNALNAARQAHAPAKILSEYLLRLGDISSMSGQWMDLLPIAEELASNPAQFPFPIPEESTTWLVRVFLERSDLEDARSCADRLNSSIVGVHSELQGDLAAAVLKKDVAQQHYSAAQNDYEKRSYRSSATQVILKQASFLLDQLGAVFAARTLLSPLASLPALPEPLMTFQLSLLRLRQCAALQSSDEGRNVFARARDSLEKDQTLPTTALGLLLSTAVASGIGDETLIQMLMVELEKLPVATRLFILRPFMFAWGEASTADVRLGDALNSLAELNPDDPECMMNKLALAATNLFFRRFKNADALLSDDRFFKAPSARLLALRQLRRLPWTFDPQRPKTPQRSNLAQAPQTELDAAARVLDLGMELRWGNLDLGEHLADVEKVFQRFPGLLDSQWNLFRLEVSARHALSHGRVQEARRSKDEAKRLALEIGLPVLTDAIEGWAPVLPARQEADTSFQELLKASKTPSDARTVSQAISLLTQELSPFGSAESRGGNVRPWAVRMQLPTASPNAPGTLEIEVLDPAGNLNAIQVGRNEHSWLVSVLGSANQLYALESLSLLGSGDAQAGDMIRRVLALDKFAEVECVALQIPMGPLASFPWELAQKPGDPWCLYRATERPLADSNMARWAQAVADKMKTFSKSNRISSSQLERISKALESSQTGFNLAQFTRAMDEALGFEPKPVLLISGSIEGERSLKRGYGESGVVVEQVYREAGIPCVTVPHPSADAIAELLSKLQPALVHICAGFQELEQPREARLELASDSSRYGIGTRELNALFDMLPRKDVQPLLILDARFDPEDRLRQIQLRNHFAASLFEEGKVRGIFATGCFSDRQSTHRLPVGITRILRLGAGSLRQLQKEIAQEFPGESPSALFTHNPELPVWF